MSDWIFPFYFRIKGYVIILALLNAILCVVAAVHVKQVSDTNDSLLPFEAMTFLIYVNLAFIDSICQGMTTITLRLEQRLVAMQVRTNQKQPSLIKNYMSYLAVRQIAGSLCVMLATYLKERSGSSQVNNISAAYILISILSFCCALQALLFFSEFKQSSFRRKGTTFKGQFAKFKAAITQDGGHVLLLFTFLTQLNPYTSVDFESLYSKMGQKFNSTLTFLTDPATSLSVAILMLYLVMRRVNYFNRSAIYVVAFYLLQLFVLGLNYWCWPSPPNQEIHL